MSHVRLKGCAAIHEMHCFTPGWGKWAVVSPGFNLSAKVLGGQPLVNDWTCAISMFQNKVQTQCESDRTAVTKSWFSSTGQNHSHKHLTKKNSYLCTFSFYNLKFVVGPNFQMFEFELNWVQPWGQVVWTCPSCKMIPWQYGHQKIVHWDQQGLKQRSFNNSCYISLLKI